MIYPVIIETGHTSRESLLAAFTEPRSGEFIIPNFDDEFRCNTNLEILDDGRAIIICGTESGPHNF